MLRSSTSRALLLAIACLLAITPFFWWGSPSGHDFEFHVFSWMEVLGQWKHGIVYPHWAALAHFGHGEPRFLFYPPASWTLGAALGAVLPWRMVPGAYCWIVLTLAGCSMYHVARRWLRNSDALFAAAFYALNPYYLLIIYWRSAYAELMAAALLPCVLLCLLRLKEPGPLPTLWLSLTLAAAWLTNAPAALMLHYSTAGLSLLLFGQALARERSWRPEIWRPLIHATLAVLLGAGLASFYLLPAIYEQRWINLSEVLSPGVRPQDNFLFTTLADPDHNRFNLLISIVAVSELMILPFALWFARRSRQEHVAALPLGSPTARSAAGSSSDHSLWMLVSAWGIGSAALLFSFTNPLWQHLPKLRFVQLPFRWLLCVNAALAVLLAMATRRWASRLLLCAVLLATIIIAGYRTQPPWWELATDIREMSDAVADGSGYEGTDEYVPAGVDAYNVDKKLPLVSDDAGAPVATEALNWGLTEKHFRVHTSAPENLTVRLFNYPAWDVTVNGTPTQTRTSDDVGLMVIPVTTGVSHIQIHFGQTLDRLVGSLVSLVSLFVFVVVWIKPAILNRLLAEAPRPQTQQSSGSAA